MSGWNRPTTTERIAADGRIWFVSDLHLGDGTPSDAFFGKDKLLMALCDTAGLSFQVVLTKIDKLGPMARAAIVETVAAELKTHPAAHPEIHLTSAEKQLGIAALRATLAGFASADRLSPDAAPSVARAGRAR